MKAAIVVVLGVLFVGCSHPAPGSLDLGESCSADYECKSHNCVWVGSEVMYRVCLPAGDIK